MSEQDQPRPILPAAPPTSPRSADEIALLLNFVRERDVHCPRCDYNLRNLTQPVCPECHEDLVLKVGVHRVRLWWLLLAIAPSTFCAVAAGIGVVMSILHGPPPVDAVVVFTALYLVTSGLLGVVLGVRYTWFLQLSDSRQIAVASGTWTIHMAVFLYLAIFA